MYVKIRDKNTDSDRGVGRTLEKMKKGSRNAWRANARGPVLPVDRLVSIVVFPVGER